MINITMSNCPTLLVHLTWSFTRPLKVFSRLLYEITIISFQCISDEVLNETFSFFFFFHIQSIIKSHKHYYSQKKKKLIYLPFKDDCYTQITCIRNNSWFHRWICEEWRKHHNVESKTIYWTGGFYLLWRILEV